MTCPSCQNANAEEAKFCMSCGTALSAACPQCGTELPGGARFCSQCGHQLGESASGPVQALLHQYIPKELLNKLEAARASGGMQGERRIVTMLFCDVAGSTAAAGELDPEEWAEIMNGAFEHLIAPVYRYEGTLARLMGDAILAFFGAPVAHEDDPQRAVMAGLDIVREINPYWEEVKSRWGLDCEVRVGINTGLVVVGEVGSDLRMEYTAMGDAINVAARMEQTARPGTIQVSADTHRLVAPLFEFEDLGTVEVKGKSEPVQAYRALGPKAEPGSLRGIKGLDAPLIGRDSEMETLRGLIADLRRGGGRIVSVMGDAGLGKSRLIAEMLHAFKSNSVSESSNGRSTADGGDTVAISWHEARSLSYATSVPYGPFVSLLNEYFDLRADDEELDKYRKVRMRVEALLPERVGDIAPFLATLMGIPLTGEDHERVKYLKLPQVRERTFSAILGLVAGMAAERPLVLIFEDLHWADPSSLELIEKLMPLTDELPLMILAVFRPQREEPSWRFHEVAARDYAQRYKPIELKPMDEDNSRELVANLLHVEDLPESVRALILTKAEGNPFYVEEVIRSLLDSELVVREGGHWHATQAIESIAVPDTLAGVINARLDRLDDETRRVAQSASVIGREFEFDTLADIYGATQTLDPALGELERRELIHEKAELPGHGYTYKHALTQETAYASLLLRTRRELHKKVAQCLVQLYPDRVNDIGYHYMEAREPELALPYVVESGDRAGRAYSTTEAIGYYTTALEALGAMDDGGDMALARRAHEGLGGALTFAGQIPRAVESYHTMLHLAQQSDDRPMQVSALNKLAFVTALMQGQFPEAEKHLGESQELATQCGDLPGLAELHMVYCYMRVPFGQFDDAVDHLSESAKIGAQLSADEPRLFGLTHIANTLCYLTRYEDARKATQEARELGNRMWLAEILALPTFLYHMRTGDLEAAYRSAEQGAEMAAQIGASSSECVGALFMGQVCWLTGRYEEAIDHLNRARQAGVAAGYPYLEAESLCELGAVYTDINEKMSDQSDEYHSRALALMETPVGAAMGGAGWCEVGFSRLAIGDVDGAAELFEKGLDTSNSMKFLARPMLLVGSAFVAMARSNPDEAARLLEEARQFVEEREMRHFYPLVSFAEGQYSAVSGDSESALQSFGRGEELAAEMGMRPLVLQSRSAAAGVLETLGCPDDAEAKRDAAKAMIDEIAGLFQDSSLRDLYLESATRKLVPTPAPPQPASRDRLSRLKRALSRNRRDQP